MKAAFALCALFVGSVAAFATEVEDLAPATEDLGENTGGFFSALQTSGSFTMMQAGGFEKKEAELGEFDEAALSKRREAIAAKLQDFDPRQASGPQLDLLEKALSADLGQGSTTTNAAACSGTNQGGQTTGTLDCSSNDGGPAGSECPDNLSAGSFWTTGSTKKVNTACLPFHDVNTVGPLIGKAFLSAATSGRLQGLITKGKVHHPHKTSTKTGVLALKRLKCTGTTCVVFKTVVCAKCHVDKFASVKSQKTTHAELAAWAQCIKDNAWDNAGTSTAQLKTAYRCDAKDQARADAWAKAF